jgi:ribosome-associated protein
MVHDAWLEVGTRLRIPRTELSYHATRAGGPGGQHVNTSSTRVELWWNVAQSAAPTGTQRALILERLHTRIDAEGWLRLVESGSRSQLRNRETATERLVKMLAQALRPPKVRKPTRIPRAQKAKRLEAKKIRGTVKRLRGKVRPDE